RPVMGTIRECLLPCPFRRTSTPGLPRGFFSGTIVVCAFNAPPMPDKTFTRVLIVDDHADAAESLSIVLSGEGFDVRMAHDGQTACAMIERWRPDAALLDLELPALGGLEVARRVRASPWGRAMLLLALTGYGRDADRKASLDAGFDAHLTKPVEPGAV